MIEGKAKYRSFGVFGGFQLAPPRHRDRAHGPTLFRRGSKDRLHLCDGGILLHAAAGRMFPNGSAGRRLPVEYLKHAAGARHLDRFPDSVDTLSPSNDFVRALNTVPITPGIPYHTIAGDRGRGDSPNSSDGVVPYWSSHHDGAVSEKIVPSHHPAHQNPQAIAEVERILNIIFGTNGDDARGTSRMSPAAAVCSSASGAAPACGQVGETMSLSRSAAAGCDSGRLLLGVPLEAGGPGPKSQLCGNPALRLPSL